MRKIRITDETVDRVLLLSEIKQMPTAEISADTGLSLSSVCTVIRIRKAALSQDYDTLIYLAGTSAASGLMVNCQKSLFHKIEMPPAVIESMNAARDAYLLGDRRRRAHSDESADCEDPSAGPEKHSIANLLQEINEPLSLTNRLLLLQLKHFEAAARNLKT